MTTDNKEIIEVFLANRLYIYSLLHKVFGMEPNDELLQLLTSADTSNAMSLLSESSEDILGKTPVFLKEVRNDMERSSFISDVKDEYTRLFLGPDKLVAPPWESVYRGKGGIFSADTLAVREFYRSYHLLPQEYPHVADDSLALEMAFMEELARRAQNAFSTGDEAALKYDLTGADIFLQTHLLIWIPKFMDRMKHSPSSLLYPQVCLIMSEFIQKDHELLSDVLKNWKEK